tara:strand:- start:2257 stop:2802 length:546 start_codon:yes stop_codon:yes gene_type:complete
MIFVKGGHLDYLGNVELVDDFVEVRTKAVIAYFKENGLEIDLDEIVKSSEEVAKREQAGQVYKNSLFTVNVYRGESADDMVHIDDLKGKCVWLSIKRNDKGTNIKWSDKMALQRSLLGDDWLGIEIYPPQKFMVDTANQYHLICIPPEYVDNFPFGWKHREINATNVKGGFNQLGQTYTGG